MTLADINTHCDTGKATACLRVLWLSMMLVLPALAQNSWAAAFTKAEDCVVGKRVVTRERQAGVIVKADGSSCQVRLDSTGKIDYNIFWMLEPEASAGKTPAKAGGADQPGKTEKTEKAEKPAGPAGSLPAGKYPCYTLVGSTLNYAFIDISILDGKRYIDKSGKTGSYTLAADGKISFTGPLASANARLLSGSRIGLNMNGGSFFNTSCSLAR